jgi:hypothetical protein
MADEMMFCPFCGKRLAANATFCVYCGKQIPVNHSQSDNNTSSEESNSSGNRKLLPIIMAIIAILFVGFGIKYTLGESNSGAAKSANNNTSSTTKNIAVAPATYSGWNTVNIGEVASLQYPPTMEVQSDKYRSITKHPRPAPNDIFIQQQGLNDMTPEGRSRYARILFKTHSDDSKVSLHDKLVVTKTELDEFNKEAYNATTQQLSKLNIKILSWDPIQIKTINGIDCMYYHYTRQMNNNPVVNVYNYTFCNNRYTHVLTISYRESEKAYWTAPGNDIRNVVNTLKIKPL